MELRTERILRILEKFPFVKLCFEKYISWVLTKSSREISSFALMDILLKESDGFERLQQLEDRLKRAMQILNLSDEEFIRKFGFRDDLLTNDTEKIHDILAEPLIVLDLDNNHFMNIQKLPLNLKRNGKQIKLADFKAERKNVCFAIEVKTIRTESWAKDGEPLGDATKPSWWKDMFYNNCCTKIEDKSQRVLEQLENSCHFFNCSKKMLVFYNRRLGPSTLMESSEYIDVAKHLLDKYPQINHLGIKDYFSIEMLFHPGLDYN
jgi:hypothetical protein